MKQIAIAALLINFFACSALGQVVEQRFNDIILKGPNPLVDVRAYGATGNGTTDDLDAILAAYNSLPSTGGTLYFPRGVYVIGTGNSGNGINILKSSVSLRGERGAVLKKSGTGAAITIARAASTTVTGTKITGLKITSSDTSTANTGISIAPDATNTAIDTVIEDIWVDAMGQYGIVAAGAAGTINRLHMRDIRITNNGAVTGNHVRQPLILNPSTSSTELELSNVYCQQSNDGTGSTDGCKLQHFRGANISNLSVTGGNVSTLVFDDMQDWTATNIIVRGTGGNGLQLESSATGRNVISNVICVGTFASSNAVVLAAGGLEETSLVNFDVRGQLMGATTGTHAKLRIKDSYFSSGIRIDAEATVVVNDSTVENCRLDSTAYIIGNGNVFSGNYLSGAAGTALVWDGDTGVISKNTISGPGAHGINILDGDANYIAENLVFGEGSNAINITAGTGNLVGTNQFSGAYNDGGTATTQVNTNIGGGAGIKRHLSATSSLNFGSIAATENESQTITVTGAALGDTVTVGVPADASDDLVLTAYVSATNTVKLIWYNSDLVAALDPDGAGGTYRVDVWKH